MRKLLFLTVAAMLLSAKAGWTMQNIKLGKFNLNPVISTNQSYDDNIYLAEGKSTAAWVNRSGAGINFNSQLTDRMLFDGGYKCELLNYSKSKSINNAVHHLANLGFSVQLPRDTTFGVKDQFVDTTDQATSELTARAKRLQNIGSISVNSPLRGNFGFDLDGQHTYNEYLSNDYSSLNRHEILFGGGITYRLQPKTKVYVAYHYGMLAYKNKNTTTNTYANDATYNNIDAGITGEITPRLTGMIQGGVQFRHYKDSLGTAANNTTTGGYGVQLKWQAQENTEITLYGNRSNIESEFVDSRYYTSTLTDIKATHSIRKFDLIGDAGYELVQYPEATSATISKREDKNLQLRAGVDYNIQKWLKVGVSYAYKSRVSNISGFGYRDSVTGMELKGSF